MKRPHFVGLAARAAAAWPLRARAQRQRLGILLYSDPAADPQMRTVLGALAARGYVDLAFGKLKALADGAAIIRKEMA